VIDQASSAASAAAMNAIEVAKKAADEAANLERVKTDFAMVSSAASAAAMAAIKKTEFDMNETTAISIANSAAIAAAMVAIENAKKPAVTIETSPESKEIIPETVSATGSEPALDENDRIMAIASAVAANKSSSPSDKTVVAATVQTNKNIVTNIVSTSPPPTPQVGIHDHTKQINGLLVLIAHILKQKGPQSIVPKPLVGAIPVGIPPIILPEAKPPAQVDPVKYKQAVDKFKKTIATKYPKVDIKTISVSPVAIEKDATNNDKYILFASFDVDGINKTEYTPMII